jgi:amino acid permease
MGMIMMLLTSGLGVLTLHFLGESARLAGAASFYAVCEASVPNFGVVIDTAVVVNSLLVCTSYLIVATDSFERISSTDPQFRDVWTLISAALVVPLVLLRTQDALKFTSMLAVVVLVFITIVAIIFAMRVPNNRTINPCPEYKGDGPCYGATTSPIGDDPLAFVRAFLTFVSAFKCQQNLLPIVAELQQPTTKRILVVSLGSIGLALLLYVAVALGGYFTFGSMVVGDILELYPETSAVVDVARVGIALVVITSYPLSSFAMRKSMLSLLSLCDCARRTCSAGKETSTRVDCVSPRLAEAFVLEPLPLTVSLAFVAVTLILGMLISDLGFIVELGGAIVGNLIMLVAPGLCYYRLTRKEPRRILTSLALVVAGFGLVMIPVGVVISFLKVKAKQ